MITVTGLMRLVRHIAAGNPDYVYQRIEGAGCFYHQDANGAGGAHACLVGRALIAAGIPVEDLEGQLGASETINNLIFTQWEPSYVAPCNDDEWSMLSWIDDVQHAQDRGMTWREAVKHADSRHMTTPDTVLV